MLDYSKRQLHIRVKIDISRTRDLFARSIFNRRRSERVSSKSETARLTVAIKFHRLGLKFHHLEETTHAGGETPALTSRRKSRRYTVASSRNRRQRPVSAISRRRGEKGKRRKKQRRTNDEWWSVSGYRGEGQAMFYPAAAHPFSSRGVGKRWEYRHGGIDIIETEYSCRWTCLEMVAISRKRTNTDPLAVQSCASLYQRSLISKEWEKGERGKKAEKKEGNGPSQRVSDGLLVTRRGHCRKDSVILLLNEE